MRESSFNDERLTVQSRGGAQAREKALAAKKRARESVDLLSERQCAQVALEAY